MPPLATAVAALLRSAGLSYVNSPPAATARPKKLSSTFGDNAVGFGRLAALTSVAPNRKHQLDGASSCTSRSATLKPNGKRYGALRLRFLLLSTADVRPLPALLSDCVATSRLPPPVSHSRRLYAAPSRAASSRRPPPQHPPPPKAKRRQPQHARTAPSASRRRQSCRLSASATTTSASSSTRYRRSLQPVPPRRALRSGLFLPLFTSPQPAATRFALRPFNPLDASQARPPLRTKFTHTHSMVCRCFLLSAQLHNTETHSEMKFADEVCRSKPSTVPATLASKMLLLHHAPRQQNQDSKVSVSFESSRGRRLLLEEA